MSPKIVEVLGKKDVKKDVKEIVEYVLGKKDVKELWAAGYGPVLPVIPQNFSLGSVLPVVLYVMRWGHRRGRGTFASVYGKDATIDDISTGLSHDEQRFQGFGGKPEQAVLGDLLLAYCLENKGHETGRDQPVQRVLPAHYFSSWVDLPVKVADLRGVPEVVAAVLAHQSAGASVSRGQRNGNYSIGVGFEQNLLLRLFGAGTSIGGHRDNVRTDHFEERTPLGIDQLMAIRLAQSLGEAPMKVRGEASEVPNQQPVAQLASERLYEDLDVFLRNYGRGMPRQSLLPMLESCIAISLMNIFLSTLDILLQWSASGTLPQKHQQKPWPLFVDCSGSADMSLRKVSEECFDDLIRRMLRLLPRTMMCLRILDQRACQERMGLPPIEPDPTRRINFLGDLLFGRLEGSNDIERDLRKDCNKLSDALKQKGEIQVCQILDSEAPHPAWRLAEALVTLMGDKLQGAKFRQFLDSCLMVDQPNGIAQKHRGTLKGKSAERHSVILTNTVLDFLVHRHLPQATKKGGQNLSLADFILIVKERYGFYIDEVPPGLSIPADELRKNRGYFERRLRDLGLFAGVNDAEAMKRLRPRFEVDNDTDY